MLNSTIPARIAVKICGLTLPEQAIAIAQMGVSALGFITVPHSPRYVSAPTIAEICRQLPPAVLTVAVVANLDLEALANLVTTTGVQALQLHGSESPEFCQSVRQTFPNIVLIKALRVQSAATLAAIPAYASTVDRILLDAYHPQQLGGTGQPFDWTLLKALHIPCPWWLAGGITPENCRQAIAQTQPQGIDLASGVESRPGVKDLGRVAALLSNLGINANHSLYPEGSRF
ncbi:phosphoribosylanthranilate isomerase [Thermosynechococcus vestitus]|uniref:N-(5'-phosphoribosyl)anthranilate isomerase n=1 Tax=Thermosynechococcus vestitus (strain NIES-2133 / IAM M-273 / BP-1) TaxID=197221 RepID=TRPF_THEVB|nr:phosphoribosylanthranilate isomerase [Thermosynechococcus vestitus]Q8DGP3.1 RecName: Full=N-(5'-phosphoribosyl)anthranilate isomerase; Short=PRAI [Thermosynechococcus vestitus BP-1]BAC09824.1 N-(5'-phosphoribosyl)anthranilate isomerase [Thermosynechococcus vestitus BP-1]BAY52727.1 N-(5'-phosphoribosyl)anthranilate isomerase [Thermostichus vulcanus NIES-2134]